MTIEEGGRGAREGRGLWLGGAGAGAGPEGCALVPPPEPPPSGPAPTRPERRCPRPPACLPCRVVRSLFLVIILDECTVPLHVFVSLEPHDSPVGLTGQELRHH